MQLLQLLWPGALAVQAVHVAARLGIADLLSRRPTFDGAMSSVPAYIDAAVSSYDFSGIDRIVDVGGARGALLRAILAANPPNLTPPRGSARLYTLSLLQV